MSSRLSGWRYRAVVWSVLLAVAAYLALSIWGGREGILKAIGEIGSLGVAVVLGLSLVNYLGRFLRWQIYLGTLGHPVRWWRSLLIYFSGFAMTITPAKAGEALRSLLLAPHGVPYGASLSALLVEKLSDLLAVLLLALIGLNAYPALRPLVVVGMGSAAAALILLSRPQWLTSLHRLVFREQAGRIAMMTGRALRALSQASGLLTPRLIVVSTALSLGAWFAEAWAFHLVLEWMSADVEPLQAISFYAMAMLAGALSFMPGGLGGAEAVMIALLTFSGVGIAQAISATVVIRLATLWFAVALGAVALLLQRAPRGAGSSV